MFGRWLMKHKRPCSDASLARYLAVIHQASKGCAQARCEVTVAAERWYSKRISEPSIVGSTTRLVLIGIRR